MPTKTDRIGTDTRRFKQVSVSPTMTRSRPARRRIVSVYARELFRRLGFWIVLAAAFAAFLMLTAPALGQPYADAPAFMEELDEVAVVLRDTPDEFPGISHPGIVFRVDHVWGVYEIPVLSPAGAEPIPPVTQLVLYGTDARFIRFPFPPAELPETIPGDLDRDGDVDSADLAILVGAWTGPKPE